MAKELYKTVDSMLRFAMWDDDVNDWNSADYDALQMIYIAECNGSVSRRDASRIAEFFGLNYCYD